MMHEREGNRDTIKAMNTVSEVLLKTINSSSSDFTMHNYTSKCSCCDKSFTEA